MRKWRISSSLELNERRSLNSLRGQLPLEISDRRRRKEVTCQSAFLFIDWSHTYLHLNNIFRFFCPDVQGIHRYYCWWSIQTQGLCLLGGPAVGAVCDARGVKYWRPWPVWVWFVGYWAACENRSTNLYQACYLSIVTGWAVQEDEQVAGRVQDLLYCMVLPVHNLAIMHS